MSRFIERLLKQKDPPPLDTAKAVEHLLPTLSRCTGRVVAASAQYDEKQYKCDVIVDTADLIPWAEHHACAVWCSKEEIQTARIAFPHWLRAANFSDLSLSYIAHPFFAVLHPYVSRFVKEGLAEVFCLKCRGSASDISIVRLNEREAGHWSWWTDEWRCATGHILYRKDNELRYLQPPTPVGVA